MLLGNWNNWDLSWRQPERPLSSEMLYQNCSASFDRSQNSSVDNDWSFEASFEFLWESIYLLFSEILMVLMVTFFFLLIFISLNSLTGLILKIESLRKIEVQLNCSQLMKPSKTILNLNINFRSIKSSISSIEFPGSVHLIQNTFELFFSWVPKLNISNELLRSGREFQTVLESKKTINKINELKLSDDLILNLILSTKNMSIVLMELSYPGQASQGTRNLIPMKNTKVCDSQRHVSEASQFRLEDQTMGRTVHWLKSKLFIFHATEKHVFGVLEIMTAGFPELIFEHGWGVDLGESSVEVLLSH